MMMRRGRVDEWGAESSCARVPRPFGIPQPCFSMSGQRPIKQEVRRHILGEYILDLVRTLS